MQRREAPERNLALAIGVRQPAATDADIRMAVEKRGENLQGVVQEHGIRVEEEDILPLRMHHAIVVCSDKSAVHGTLDETGARKSRPDHRGALIGRCVIHHDNLIREATGHCNYRLQAVAEDRHAVPVCHQDRDSGRWSRRADCRRCQSYPRV